MSGFIPSPKTAQDFNNGVKYVNGDGTYTGDVINADTINNVIESQLYSQAQAGSAKSIAESVKSLATNQPDTSLANNVGTPEVTIEENDGSPRFVFKNLKGLTGGKGDKGDSGVVVLSNGMFYISTDETTGDIYAEYIDGDTPPQFELDNNGDLYYII